MAGRGQGPKSPTLSAVGGIWECHSSFQEEVGCGGQGAGRGQTETQVFKDPPHSWGLCLSPLQAQLTVATKGS